MLLPARRVAAANASTTQAHAPGTGPLQGSLARAGEAAATCSDKIQNGDETGTDCGGGCAACVPCPVALGRSNPGSVSTTMTINKNIDLETAGGAEIAAFKQAFIADVAARLGVDPSLIVINGLAAAAPAWRHRRANGMEIDFTVRACPCATCSGLRVGCWVLGVWVFGYCVS